MSSNEDDTTQEKSTTRYIHTHPYRSAEATTLIRTIDEEIHNDQLHSISVNARGNRPNQRMTDALHSASDRAVAILFKVQKFMPLNFYNLAALEAQQDL